MSNHPRSILAASSLAILLPLCAASPVLAVGTGPNTTAASATSARYAQVPTARTRSGRGGVAILQIGDSHTAADRFTGTVRDILQERFGQGGIGYLNVGVPHPGVRSTALTVSASSGWSYEGIQRSAHPDAFGLSGFNASTNREGETLSFTRETPVAYAKIEIEARTGPEAGSLVVEADDVPLLTASLAADVSGPRLLTILPQPGRDTFRTLVVRTRKAKPVTVSALGIFRQGAGITYSSIGFPGATIDIVDRLATATATDDLRRLRPDIVVLAFGTNEGFDAKLDAAAYRDRYLSALQAIRNAVPKAHLVMVGPPQGERPAPACKPDETGPCRPVSAAEPSPIAREQGACPQRPAQLDRVREVQRRVAEAEKIPFWDWWAIMPPGCGASRWVAADPPLMARDHVHFTAAGYRTSGQAFAAFLEQTFTAALRGEDAVSHH